MPGNSAAVIRRREREAKAVELRKNQRLSIRAIAEVNGCSHETARRDINGYLKKLDQACMENAGAIRAELYEQYDQLLQAQAVEIFDKGNLDRAPELLKTSEQIRKLYGLDVPSLGRTEMAMRRAAVTEVATRLRDALPPEVFAQVLTALSSDEYELIDGVAVESGGATAAQPPRLRREGSGAAEGPGGEGWGATGDDLGLGGEALPVVFDSD